MHINLFKTFYYIDKFNKEHLEKLNKNINIIYRNYKNTNEEELIKLRKFSKKKGFKIYLANNINLAIKLKYDGLYLPSFNYSKIIKEKFKKNFLLLGSAHNTKEIKIKEKQGIDYLFLSPLFKTKHKNELGIIRFNLLSKFTKKKIIALGGINQQNIKKLNLLNINGYASITFIKKQYE